MDDQAGPPANPYAAPAASEAPIGPADVTRDEVIAFSGHADEYYWNRWSRAGFGTGLWPSWNWAAAIFGMHWFAYRKMWRECLLLMIAVNLIEVVQIVALASFRFSFLGTTLPHRLVVGAVVGIFANAVYLRRARRAISEVRLLIPESLEGRTAYLGSVGGTNGWFVLASIGASVVFNLGRRALLLSMWRWLS